MNLIATGNPFNADGLYVNASGTITVQNTVAAYNNAYGFALHNAPAKTTPVVIRMSTVNYNHYGGIYINTASNLTVTDTSANNNDTWGLYVETDGTVTINCTKPLGYCTSAITAPEMGWIYMPGKPLPSARSWRTTMAMTAMTMAWTALLLHTPPIILTNISVEGNWQCGVLADTENNVTITNVVARYNHVGVLVGTEIEPVNNVLISGANLFDSNYSGLEVYALGMVNISNVTAQYQTGGTGIYVVSITDGKTVTMNNILSRYNYDDGLYISSYGNVNLNTVRCLSNGNATTDGEGLYMWMHDPEDIITIRNSVFTFNAGNGIEANLIDPNDYTKFKLINTSWLGNDSDNDGNADLYLY